MNRDVFDIAIAGAGPAGSACALALKDSGLKIALIDKSTFPRDKICGDAIGGRVKKVLKEIDPDLLQDLDNYPSKNKSSGWKLFSPNGKTIEVNFVNPGYVSRRLDFDSWLYNKTIGQENLEMISSEIRDITSDSNVVQIALSGCRNISTALVIGCDGAHSIVAKKLANFKVDHRHYSGAVRAYYKNVEGTSQSEMLEIHLVKGFLPGYFWIFPLNDGLCNVGFGMLSSDIKERRIDLKISIKQIIQSSGSLSKRFANAELVDDVKGFGLPLGGKQRSISGNRFMLCGDAGSLIDPLTGEGIGNAMLSGLYAARQAKDCFKKNNFIADFMKTYDENVYKKLLPELKKNLFMQRAFNRPWLINTLVNIAIANPGLKNWFAKKL
ncbi:MAG: NAD(P)/FAD-dependent oxidoreductase [Bacteroidota bacterium]